MTTSVDKWQVNLFFPDGRNTEATLNLSPGIQRRDVWSLKKQMLLIDSIIRKVPINAITLYQQEDPETTLKRHDVIDGKQRLTAIRDYKDEKFKLDPSSLEAAEKGDLWDIGIKSAEEYFDLLWSELTPTQRAVFNQYEIPVFIVDGDKRLAVQAFTRMNQDATSLSPQEIRHAVYENSGFMNEVINICVSFNSYFTNPDSVCGFNNLGQIPMKGDNSWERMADWELASELLAMAIDGPQETKKTIDQFYDKYKDPRGKNRTELDTAERILLKTLKQIITFTDEGQLRAIHITNVNDFYALVGALINLHQNVGAQQIKDVNDEARSVMSELFRQVALFKNDIVVKPDFELADYAPQVSTYARIAGGQVNSKLRRTTRIAVLDAIFDEFTTRKDPRAFTATTRELIWAMAPDGQKFCGVCGDQVAYEDFEAGHIDDKVHAGPPTPENGQIEHFLCNRGKPRSPLPGKKPAAKKPAAKKPAAKKPAAKKPAAKKPAAKKP
jgi:hypothetical protein